MNSISDLLKVANEEYPVNQGDFSYRFTYEFCTNIKILPDTAGHENADYSPPDSEVGYYGGFEEYAAWVLGITSVSKENIVEFLISKNKDLVDAVRDYVKSSECHDDLEAVGIIDEVKDILSDELYYAFSKYDGVDFRDYFNGVGISLNTDGEYNKETRHYDPVEHIRIEGDIVYFDIKFEALAW